MANAKFLDQTGLTHFKGKIDGELAKKANVNAIPSNVSQLTNDSDYQTGTQVSSAIATAVGGITGFEYRVLGPEEELPEEGTKGTIYLKPIDGSEDKNIHEEYIWIGNKYEKLGTTAVDLSEYFNTSNLTAISTGDIDAMFA